MDPFWRDPLVEACRKGNAKGAFAYLVFYNWENDSDRKCLEESLMAVCDSHRGSHEDKAQIATMLINKGTDVDLLGRALLAACRQWGCEELASLLLDRGADPNYRSFGPPLVIVCRRDHPHAFARMLLDCGADPCLCDDHGTTHAPSCSPRSRYCAKACASRAASPGARSRVDHLTRRIAWA